MEAVRTSETSVDNHFTRQYNPEDSSEHHTRRRENLKSHTVWKMLPKPSTDTLLNIILPLYALNAHLVRTILTWLPCKLL
jgi:hypothetical protein